MLRPLIAVSVLAFAAFLLAPTVSSVQQGVEELEFKREFPWDIWKWDDPEPPASLIPPKCDQRDESLYSEVTDWPDRIRKDEDFSLGGIVTAPGENHRGIEGISVDLYLNETKEEPGIHLGLGITDANGRFTLDGRFPHDLQATKYHLVAHAHERQIGCVTYLEHWSDPEMNVIAETRIVWDVPDRAVHGHVTEAGGWLLDSVGGPVRNAEIDFFIDGKETKVHTDQDGRFFLMWTPDRTGDIAFVADSDATEHYGASHEETFVEVVEEDVVLQNLVGNRLELTRGETTQLRGQVLLRDNMTPSTLVLEFDGVLISSCDGCEPSARHEITPQPDGTFVLPLLPPHGQPLGSFSLRFTEGGLQRPSEYDGAMFGTIQLSLEADVTRFFGREYEARVSAKDDSGQAVPGEIAVSGPDGWHRGTSEVTYAASDVPCGNHRVRALHNGTDYLRPAVAEKDVAVCGYLAFIPAWMLAIPWWGWLLVLAIAVAAYYTARRLHDRYAATIARGPPLTLSFTEPRDAAAGIVGVGEAATVTAFLEEPLPDGYTMRIGTYRALQRAEIGPDLRASTTVTPDELGEVAIRGEVLDRKGRVVSRRTAKLRVVHYGEEIETRYLALRRAKLGEDSEPVTPREFQAWLLERAPEMSPETAGRLVALFEEADYGPREIGRAELVAYMEAESAVPTAEVNARAVA